LAWIIKYTESATRQLKKLDRPVALRVLDYLDERVAILEDPRSLGKKLVGPKMGEYWRYRVGDIRIICDITDGQMRILVIEVGHRREVYR
jgi:mRNA interferase RelE/StbE